MPKLSDTVKTDAADVEGFFAKNPRTLSAALGFVAGALVMWVLELLL